jgi:hypothetical protein
MGLGWTLLANFVGAYFNEDYRYLVLITSFIALIPIFLRAWLSFANERPFTIIFFYIFLCYLFMSLNISRQMMAVGIAFFSFDFVVKSKYVHFYIFAIIALLFHSSALICFIVPFVNKITFKKWHIWALPISYFVGLFGVKIINNLPLISYYAYYLEDSRELFSVTRLMLILLISIIIYFIKDKNNLYVKLLFFGAIILNITAFNAAASRISLYFLSSQFIVYGYLLTKNNCSYNNMLKFGVYCYGFLYFFIYLLSGDGEIVPYILLGNN